MYRETGEDGTVRYTLRRTPDAATPEDASPPTVEARDAEGEPEAEPRGRELNPERELESVDAPGSATPSQDIRDQIERDREKLREIVSRGDPDSRESPELREISERLPKLQDELKAVEEEPSP